MKHIPGIFTITETASVLGVHPATVRRYSQDGILNIRLTTDHKRKFCTTADIQAFLKKQYEYAAVPDGSTIELMLTKARYNNYAQG